MGFFGLNVLPNRPSNSQLIADIKALNSPATLIMSSSGRNEEMGTAFEVLNAHSGIVIHRTYDKNDHQYHMIGVNPDQYIDTLSQLPRHSRLYHQVLNEPSGYENLDQLVTFVIACMAAASQKGIKLAVPNFAVGHPTDDVSRLRGPMQRLGAAFMAYPGHILTVHEYFDAPPNTQRYKIGRVHTLLEWVPSFVPVYITEYGHDIGGGVDDGWRTHISEAGYAAWLMQGADMYSDRVKGVCIYSYGDGYGWHNFNIAGTSIISRIKDYNRKVSDNVAFDYGQMTPAVITGNFPGVRIRATPGVAGTIVTSGLALNERVLISERGIQFDTYTWHKIFVRNIEGFVAIEVIQFRRELPPEPEPETPLYALFLTKDEAQQLINLFTSISDKASNAVETFAELSDDFNEAAGIIGKAMERHGREVR